MTASSTSIGRLGLAARMGVVLVVVAAGLAGFLAPPEVAAQGSGLETLGELDLGCPDDSPPGGTAVRAVNLDADARRLYAVADCASGQRLVVHDISSELPTVAQVSPPIPDDVETLIATSYTIRVSRENDRLYWLTFEPGGSRNGIIAEFDLRTLEYLESWNIGREIPGFFPVGFDHDPDLNRFYLIGTTEGNRYVQEGNALGSGVGTAATGTAIAAVGDTSGELIWINPLPDCDTPLTSDSSGGLVAQSAGRPMLYAFCAAGSAAFQQAGQGGVMRLDVSDQAGKTGVVDFSREFFPVSGDYTSGRRGVAGLDRVRERFVAHSLSAQTHGAWVFDGQRSSWIGFVAAPDSTNSYYGLDPATGKHYMAGPGSTLEGGGPGYVNVTDAGATPVPQGRLFDDIRSPSPWARDWEEPLRPLGNILVDPVTGRLFVQYFSGSSGPKGVLVLRDTTPPITQRTPLDLDELTHDIPDDDEARLEFSANTSGFGAQYIQVGGWENVYTRPSGGFFDISGLATNPAEIRYGSRGATMSLVEGVGIAQSGASASAIATKPDENTPGDVETKQNDLENQANEHTDGGFDDLSEAVDDASSDDDDSDDEEVQEARYVTCLDGADDGETVRDEQGSEEEPAHALVVCDLTGLKATALARFSGGSGGGGVIVSESSFDGKTYRDPERGVVTETEAVAEGIFFGEVDLGGFSIDRVTSTATTWAHGLDGTSHVRWVRTVEGMRTIGADGSAGEPTSCTTIVESGKKTKEEGDADCKGLQEDLNDLMPNRFEVKFPLPEVVATPGGAFASVQENETDFLSGQATNNDERRMAPGMEMTVFADGPQRGRLWVQLAAVKADATFIRSPKSPEFDLGDSRDEQTTEGPIGEPSTDEPTAPAEDFSGGDTVAIPPPGGDDVPPPEVDQDPPTTLASHQEKFVGAFGWLPALRSAGDAALTGALYVLFLLPAAEVVRRRRLLDVLTDAPATDGRQSLAKRPVAVSASPVRSTS